MAWSWDGSPLQSTFQLDLATLVLQVAVAGAGFIVAATPTTLQPLTIVDGRLWRHGQWWLALVVSGWADRRGWRRLGRRLAGGGGCPGLRRPSITR